VLLAGAVEVNALAQGALRQFTQWMWIEHPTFQLGGGHLTELLPPHYFCAFTHYELFVSFRFLNFGFKINRINPLLVIISSKLLAITNVIHKLLWELQTIPNDN